MRLERFCFILGSREQELVYGTEGMPVRILIADDWPNVQTALRVLLEQQAGLVVVGEVVDARELLAQIEANCPDVVLLGWELPGLVGAELLPAVRRVCPDTFVVVLSGRPDARRAALAAGADVFVSKVAPPERLLSAILDLKRTESGEQYLDGRLSSGRHEPHQRPAQIASPGSVAGDDRDQRKESHLSTCRRSTMVQVEKKRKDTLKYVAVIAAAVVLLACIAAGLAVSLTLISEIPFHHIFPH
jgi:DNA-binding NarL/FixJ family response regulator